jgi:hypothetical protein
MREKKEMIAWTLTGFITGELGGQGGFYAGSRGFLAVKKMAAHRAGKRQKRTK